jgi:uncharacterized membrane protein
MDYAKIYGAMAVAFLALDSIWLGVVAKNLYKKYIGHVMAANPNFIAAGIFYAVFLFGLLMLVVLPAGRAHSLTQALWGGALFGLVCYATYDLTSQAVIKNWPTTITVIDLLWGTFVTTLVALIGYWASSVLFV